MKTLLDEKKIKQAVADLSDQVFESCGKDSDIAVIGIRSRGEVLAKRLAESLSDKKGENIPFGTLDITLYRDDINSPEGDVQPVVRTTEIGFNIDGKIIILADDVLYTGRSTRAAMDALIDLGRPKKIRLAVLIDRKGREFPIQADYAGYKTDVPEGESVQVNFIESDGRDLVFVEQGS